MYLIDHLLEYNDSAKLNVFEIASRLTPGILLGRWIHTIIHSPFAKKKNTFLNQTLSLFLMLLSIISRPNNCRGDEGKRDFASMTRF
jgi:hypothetical protein